MYVFVKLCCLFLLPYWISAGSSSSEEHEKHKKHRLNIINKFGFLDSNYFQLNSYQKLNHYDITDGRRWTQRYLINYDHYMGDGPVFFIMGGREQIQSKMILSGAWYHYAKESKALLIYLEHRYYGESIPTINLLNRNLVWLSNEQALSDAANFIDDFILAHPLAPLDKAKWIAFGANTGAPLAARMRLKFPHLVYAAVASSGALLETVNFSEYFEVVEKELSKNSDVKKNIKNAYKKIEEEINKQDFNKLVQKLKICSFRQIFANDNYRQKNIKLLYWTISHILGILVVFGNQLGTLKKTALDILDHGFQSHEDALTRLGEAVNLIVNAHGEECLFVDYETMVIFFKDGNLKKRRACFILAAVLGNRESLFQRCTESGQFETSEKKENLFGDDIKLDFLVDLCKDVFGEKFNLKFLKKGVERAKIFYGGVDIEVGRILFINGEHDPISKLSVTKTDKKKDIIVLNVNDGTHCDDVLIYTKENKNTTKVQNEVKAILKDWLNREDE